MMLYSGAASWLAPTLAPTIAVIVAHVLTRLKLSEIHVLVNSRLTTALVLIKTLQRKLGLPEDDGSDVLSHKEIP
jgi:hypothetical protein